MEDIMGWIKQVVCYLCVFQIFLQILPDGTSKKYVQFFGSLILVLLVARPLTDLTGTTLDLEKEIRFFMAQEELSELTMGMEGLNELQNDSIDEAFRRVRPKGT